LLLKFGRGIPSNPGRLPKVDEKENNAGGRGSGPSLTSIKARERTKSKLFFYGEIG